MLQNCTVEVQEKNCKKSCHVLNPFRILCWAASTAVPGHIQSMGHGFGLSSRALAALAHSLFPRQLDAPQNSTGYLASVGERKT